jgi:abortive infection bacteriophage resistance protein
LRYACKQNGRLAERLGRALQKLVQQFESAIDLVRNLSFHKFRLMKTFFLASPNPSKGGEARGTVLFLRGGDGGFHGGTQSQ